MCIDNKIQLYLKIIIQLKKLFVIVKFVVWQVHVRYSIVEVHLLFSQFKNAFFLSNRIWVEVMSRGDVKCVGTGVSLSGNEFYINNFLAMWTWTSYFTSLASISLLFNEDKNIYPIRSLRGLYE